MNDIYKLGLEKGYSKNEIDLITKKIIKVWENIKTIILDVTEKIKTPEIQTLIKMHCDKELRKYEYMYSKVKSKRLKKKYKKKINKRISELKNNTCK